MPDDFLKNYKGTLPLTMEMFPVSKPYLDEEGYEVTSNIGTATSEKDGKTYLYPTFMGGLSLPMEAAKLAAFKGKHFGVYDTRKEADYVTELLHKYFDKIKGYQDGGLTSAEPASTNVHNNIDNLILQAEKVYKGYQDGDVVDSLLSLYGGLQAKPSPGASPELSKLPTYSPGGDDNKLFRTLLNLIGRPALIEGKLKFPYQRFTLPIGGKTAFTAERDLGLH